MTSEQTKKILIIGATGGIGEAITKTLSSLGHELILAGHNEDTLQALAQTLTGNNVTTKVDLSNKDEVIRWANTIKEKHLSIDWIIHTAGYIEDPILPFEEGSPLELEKTMQINMHAPVEITRILLPIINTGGGVIPISSTAGTNPNGKHLHYSISKAALNAFATALALHIKFSDPKKDLRIVTVCPGPTNTSLRERIAHDALQQQSPLVITQTIKEILDGTYTNGDIVVVKNSEITIYSRL